MEQLSQYEGVRLFIERARSVKPDFAVTNESAPAVAEICHRLDGLPLAIELAAARIAILSPQAMLSRLQSRLKLLTGGARDLPVRQQTLRGTLEWSHDLLDTEEQMLFRRLAVFAGTFSLEAAEEITSTEVDPGGFEVGSALRRPRSQVIEDLNIDVLDGVMSLTSKSLLRQVEGSAGETRFGMLETIREYALEKLINSGEAEELCRRQALYYLRRLWQYQGHMITRQLDMLGDIITEYDNTKAAFDYIFERGDLETVARLAMVLAGFWNLAGTYSDGRAKAERAVAALESGEWTGNDLKLDPKLIKACVFFLAASMAWASPNEVDKRKTLAHNMEEAVNDA